MPYPFDPNFSRAYRIPKPTLEDEEITQKTPVPHTTAEINRKPLRALFRPPTVAPPRHSDPVIFTLLQKTTISSLPPSRF
jgi:hypothetical protein